MISLYENFCVHNRELKLKTNSTERIIHLPVGVCVQPKTHRILIKSNSKEEKWLAVPRTIDSYSGAVQIYPSFSAINKLAIKDKIYTLKFWQVINDKDRYDCQMLVSNVHYLMGPNRGAILACGVNTEVGFSLVGCAFLDKMTYTSSLNNRQCFLKGDREALEDCRRGELVRKFGISWVSRFVVAEAYQKCGIGSLLAQNVAKMAAKFFSPASSYVEVYTTRPKDEIEQYKEQKKSGNFLTTAGFEMKKDFKKYAKFFDHNYDADGFKLTKPGRRLYYFRDVRPFQDRLFLPLKINPYLDFLSGKKKWEIRNISAQYNKETVYVGRRVEARCGYRADNTDRRPLWGTICEVREFDSVGALVDSIPVAFFLPKMKGGSVCEMLKSYLRIEKNGAGKMIAFKIKLDG